MRQICVVVLALIVWLLHPFTLEGMVDKKTFDQAMDEIYGKEEKKIENKKTEDKKDGADKTTAEKRAITSREKLEEVLLADSSIVHAYKSYEREVLAHRSSAFRWQLMAARIIFFLVILLVLVGIYFSWIQFHKDIKLKVEDRNQTLQEIEIGAGNIKVKSAILGVVILALSLAFFYLYLERVFPISVIE